MTITYEVVSFSFKDGMPSSLGQLPAEHTHDGIRLFYETHTKLVKLALERRGVVIAEFSKKVDGGSWLRNVIKAQDEVLYTIEMREVYTNVPNSSK